MSQVNGLPKYSIITRLAFIYSDILPSDTSSYLRHSTWVIQVICSPSNCLTSLRIELLRQRPELKLGESQPCCIFMIGIFLIDTSRIASRLKMNLWICFIYFWQGIQPWWLGTLKRWFFSFSRSSHSGGRWIKSRLGLSMEYTRYLVCWNCDKYK